jgi:sulfate adenylyltransferase subunit 2
MHNEISHLESLEAEAVHLIREVLAELEKPALLFSGGKDSAVLLSLAMLSVKPKKLWIPIVHIDTGHNFKEVIEFRDRIVEQNSLNLIVGSVQESIDLGTAVEDPYSNSRNKLQTVTLLETIEKYKFDALFGGARRDEEKARAKERFLSHRDTFGQWNPRSQRPEIWHLYNTKHNSGEHFRVFPLSNWTELDIWKYINLRHLELPSIYFAHKREVVRRNFMLVSVTELTPVLENEESFITSVRYRTVGDMTCTAAVESLAGSIDEIIVETQATRISERGATRVDDKFSEAAMEDRKKEGYF